MNFDNRDVTIDTYRAGKDPTIRVVATHRPTGISVKKVGEGTIRTERAACKELEAKVKLHFRWGSFSFQELQFIQAMFADYDFGPAVMDDPERALSDELNAVIEERKKLQYLTHTEVSE